jgi:uncharacterized glyoxalase superfamily protein PhnB
VLTPGVYDPAEGFPRVVPAIRYADVDAAVDWLSRVFGFRELLRLVDGGRVQHADMELEGGLVMLEAAAGPRDAPAGADARTSVLVHVADVDGHRDRAAAEGATVVLAPESKPWGLRRYRVTDLEGHLWEFVQHVRSVPPRDWGAQGRGV